MRSLRVDADFASIKLDDCEKSVVEEREEEDEMRERERSAVDYILIKKSRHTSDRSIRELKSLQSVSESQSHPRSLLLFHLLPLVADGERGR